MQTNRFQTFTIGSYRTPNSRCYFVDTLDMNEKERKTAQDYMFKVLEMRRRLNEAKPCWQR